MTPVFYTPLPSPALGWAEEGLRSAGLAVAREPVDTVTHLLLPAPLRGQPVLPDLPEAVLVGGALDRPELESRRKLDLLQDPIYLGQNAAITAHCALTLALQAMPVTLAGQKVLVIGWGRIGKCLARLLRGLDARVTVAARKESDRAQLLALGYGAAPIQGLTADGFRVVFNTVPHPVLSAIPKSCLAIELASKPGLSGGTVVDGRSLPGRMAPESSGALIAQTILRRLEETP